MKAKIERRNVKNNKIRELVQKAKKVCNSFFDECYVYDNAEAIEELGLDEELIDQLIEDYVSQIIYAVIEFEEMLYVLQSEKDATIKIDRS